MKQGDLLETAIWLSGAETQEQIDKWRLYAQSTLSTQAGDNGCFIGPMSWVKKRPGQERVPQVPKHISGPDVRLLIGTAEVLGYAKGIIKQPGFVADLDSQDLHKLRDITRKAHRKAKPHARQLTDEECDCVIEAIGPGSAVATLRDMKVTH